MTGVTAVGPLVAVVRPRMGPVLVLGATKGRRGAETSRSYATHAHHRQPGNPSPHLSPRPWREPLQLYPATTSCSRAGHGPVEMTARTTTMRKQIMIIEPGQVAVKVEVLGEIGPPTIRFQDPDGALHVVAVDGPSGAAVGRGY
jgi:hypothetical protein